jgi:hypothetical protein
VAYYQHALLSTTAHARLTVLLKKTHKAISGSISVALIRKRVCLAALAAKLMLYRMSICIVPDAKLADQQLKLIGTACLLLWCVLSQAAEQQQTQHNHACSWVPNVRVKLLLCQCRRTGHYLAQLLNTDSSQWLSWQGPGEPAACRKDNGLQEGSDCEGKAIQEAHACRKAGARSKPLVIG